MMIITEINEDDDMANPYNVDSRSDDIDDELDEEDEFEMYEVCLNISTLYSLI